MKHRFRMVTCTVLAMLATFVILFTGCGGTASKIIEPPAAGFIPMQISQLTDGGALLDGEPTQQHDGGAPSLNDLEGQWLCETIKDEHRDPNDPETYVVAEEIMILNEQKIECLPKSIDIRPYSPVPALFSQGFGYGSAVFADASDPDEYGINIINTIEMSAFLPYGGKGFVCAANGTTLALGFLNPDYKMEENGNITDKEGNIIDECAFVEADYEVSLDDGRLTISCGGASASYIRDETAFTRFHEGMFYGVGLYDGSEQVDPFRYTNLKRLSEAGYDVNCDMDEMLASLHSSNEFLLKAPDGSVFKAKVFNPYEKNVPLWYLPISWYQYDIGDGNLTVGRGTESNIDLGMTQVFGTSSYAQVYSYYPLPYDKSVDYLCYKTGASARIEMINVFGKSFDAGNTLVESEHSCDIRFGFTNGILTSFTKEDSAYTSAGLQDNVAHDDLAELEPSVYRDVEERRDEILDELKKSFKKAGLDVAINEKTGEVVTDNNVLFATGSYELGDAGKAYLDKMFSAYASVVLDEKYSGVLKEVSFEGNTDSDGDSEYNMRLSENRAKAVMEYCSSMLNNSEKSTFDGLSVCRGFGESDLVYDENGEEDKGASRRVAIKFMLNVDSLKSGAGSQMESESVSSASASSSSSASSENVSSPSDRDTQAASDELSEFHSISGKFDQAWSLYEESESDGSKHVVVLLLSKDHGYCGYFDLKVDASSTGSGEYTFGETSIDEENQNTQAITVHHSNGDDRLDVIFNAWGKDDMVSIKDAWKGVYDLTAFDDVEYAVSLFEEILAE